MTGNTWPISEAKNKFSEVVRRAQSEGPQYITIRGRKRAVVISIPEYERWKARRADHNGGEAIMTEKTWQLQEAKQKLSKVVHCAEEDGAQHISVHGHDEVVVLEAEDYEHGEQCTPQPSESIYDWFKRTQALRAKRDESGDAPRARIRRRPGESLLDWFKRSGVWAAGIDVELDLERDPNDVGRDIDLSDL